MEYPPANYCWICPACALCSTQTDKSAFVRHFESLHADEVVQQENSLPPEAFQCWRADIVKLAFAVSNRPSSSLSQAVNVTTASGMQKFEKLDLSSSSLHQSSGGTEEREGSRPGGLSQPLRNNIRLANRQNSTTARPRPRLPPPQPTREFAMHMPTNRKHHGLSNDESPRSNASPVQPSPPRRRSAIEIITDPRWPNLIMQADSKGISQEQLAKEVRSIYAGLTMVETKAIAQDKQKTASGHGPSPEAWRAMIGIHRALLNEHHDFFLASQHPSASEPLHRLARKYNMPAIMWKHSIYTFLGLRRHHLPHSRKFITEFNYQSYQFMNQLLETAPAFKDTWIECLGDLSRMATEDEDLSDRDIWANVARYWYYQAADGILNVGRLYRHLAIVARPNAQQMLYLYAKSPKKARPSISARDSIQSLLDLLLRDETTQTETLGLPSNPLSCHSEYVSADENVTKTPRAKVWNALSNRARKQLQKFLKSAMSVLSRITRPPNHILRFGFLYSLVLSTHANPTQSIVLANHNGRPSWLMPGLMVPVAAAVGHTLLRNATLRRALSKALLFLNTQRQQIFLAGLDVQMIELFIVEGLRRQLQGSVQQAVEMILTIGLFLHFLTAIACSFSLWQILKPDFPDRIAPLTASFAICAVVSTLRAQSDDLLRSLVSLFFFITVTLNLFALDSGNNTNSGNVESTECSFYKDPDRTWLIGNSNVENYSRPNPKSSNSPSPSPFLAPHVQEQNNNIDAEATVRPNGPRNSNAETANQGKAGPMNESINKKRRTGSSSARNSKSRRIGGGEDGGEGNDGDSSQDDPSLSPPSSNDIVRINWRCPFYKHDPIKYRECGKLILRSPSRVKHHLARSHEQPEHCPRCLEVFDSEEQKQQHTETVKLECIWREGKIDGLTQRQARLLSKRFQPKTTYRERWYRIWQIVFPGQREPESPYVDVDIPDEILPYHEHNLSKGWQILSEELLNQFPSLRPHFMANQEQLQVAYTAALTKILSTWTHEVANDLMRTEGAPSRVVGGTAAVSAAGQGDIVMDFNSVNSAQAGETGIQGQLIPPQAAAQAVAGTISQAEPLHTSPMSTYLDAVSHFGTTAPLGSTSSQPLMPPMPPMSSVPSATVTLSQVEGSVSQTEAGDGENIPTPNNQIWWDFGSPSGHSMFPPSANESGS